MLINALLIAFIVFAAPVILGCYPLKWLLLTIVIALSVSVFRYESSVNTSSVFPQAWHVKNVIIDGTISSLPQHKTRSTHFLFSTRRINHQAAHRLLRLTWFGQHPLLQAGDAWQLQVRLKPPHGLKNPGGFDYRRWLLEQGIVATGYVNIKANYQRLPRPAGFVWLRLRQRLQDCIASSVTKAALAAITAALSVGSRALLTQSTWRVFQDSGTSHLIAISGLHVGLVAMLCYCFLRRCFSLVPRLSLCVASHRVAAMLCVPAVLLYGALAGFSLPTQRAVIMLLVLMLTEALMWAVPIWRRLLLAAVMILILQPAALFSASFYLSFMAVFWIVYAMSASEQSTMRQWLRLQCVVGLGLAPLSLYFFHQLSLVLLFANVVAIPYVSFVIVPLCLLACLSFVVSHTIAQMLFQGIAYCLQPLWWWLQALAHLPHSVWHYTLSQPWLLCLCLLAVALLLAPKSLPAKWLAALICLPIVFPSSPSIASGSAAVSVLDVGQGLSVVLQTQQHALIYDAGASVVLPYLHYLHLRQLDRLVISHADNDHIGGAAAILQQFPHAQVLSSVPQRFAQAEAIYCHAGQHWQWDGVRFYMLYPPAGMSYRGNDSSCVLWVQARHGSMLLTGDIQQPAERWLLQHGLPQATVLLVPHHGSRSSSTAAFIQRVAAKIAIVSSGFCNRYHLPAPSVVKRYQAANVKILNTAKLGAILLKI